MQTQPGSSVPVLPLVEADGATIPTRAAGGKCESSSQDAPGLGFPPVEGLSLAQVKQEQTQVQDMGAQASSTPDPLASMATPQLLDLLVLGRDPLFLLSQ